MLASVWLRQHEVFDEVTRRSSHAERTLRGGGLGIVAVVAAGGVWVAVRSGWMPLAVILCSLALVAVGSFRDDLKSLPAGFRLSLHAIAAVATLAGLGLADGVPAWLWFGGGLLWIAGYINAFNFMDGVNGLAGFQALLTAAGTAVIGSLAVGRWDLAPALTAWVVAGASAGFLPFNFPRAKMFMGDVGSASLGYLLAALALWMVRDVGVWLGVPLLLIHANFVLDTGITLARRIARGEDFIEAHREHFYQRLVRAGYGHSYVTLWEIFIQGAVICASIAYLGTGLGGRIGIIAFVLGLWTAFFVGCERALRRAGEVGDARIDQGRGPGGRGVKSLVIVGTERYSSVVAETAVSNRHFRIMGCADEDPAHHGQEVGRWPVLGHWKAVSADYFVVGIRNNVVRRQIFDALVAEGRELATIISPHASVSSDAQVGRGSVILAGAVVRSGVVIGENAVICSGAIVDHDAVLGAHAHVGPHSSVEGYACVLPEEAVPAETSRGPGDDACLRPVVAEDAALDVARERPSEEEGVTSGLARESRLSFPPGRTGPQLTVKGRIRLSVPHMAAHELEFVEEAFETNWLSTVGVNLDALEARLERLLGLPCVALINGTSALHLAVRLMGIRPGDEVLSPTLTFVASCNPICYQGGRPVFIDSERSSWNLDPNLLDDFLKQRAAVGRLPRALVAVHLFGQSADIDAIIELCREYEVQVIEDAAECLGARYKGHHPGSRGDVGIYSFNGNKIITGTSGGVLASSNAEWVQKVRFWSTQANDMDPLGLNNYVHSELGYNYRLSNVLAGIVRGQLEVLEERVQQRRAVFERYRRAFAGLPGIEPQPEADFGRPEDVRSGRTRHTRWLSCFLIDERAFGLSSADLIRALGAANIEARPVWKPMHTQPLYRGCECIGGAVAEDLNRRGICLPSSSCLAEEDQQRVIATVREAHERATVARRDRVTFSAAGPEEVLRDAGGTAANGGGDQDAGEGRTKGAAEGT